MPQIGPLEILVVAVIALVVFGPSRLPEMARQAGKTLNAFKQQAQDLRREFDVGLDEDTRATDGDATKSSSATASDSKGPAQVAP